MKYKNIYDLHTHSDCSFDGVNTCMHLCEHAADLGAKGIAITDHLDIDDESFNVRGFVNNQFIKTFCAKTAFRNSLEVFQGIELGQGIYRKEQSEKILKSKKYDFVLGSIHNLENMEDFYFLDYNDYDVDDLLKRYFEDILKLAEWDKTDSLAHLTYPLRYICGKFKIEVDLNKYSEIIDSIFETVIKNNKAIEINMSSIEKYHCDTMPGIDLVKRYKELGGKYITVGSDSHTSDNVCYGIEKGYDILLECGFNEFTIFKKRQPILIHIERN